MNDSTAPPAPLPSDTESFTRALMESSPSDLIVATLRPIFAIK